MIPPFALEPFGFFVLRTRTRFPFRYGIASLTDVPHLFVRTRVALGGRSMWGTTSEGLPPKWFTKDPATTFEQDLGEMLEAIGSATAAAAEIARSPSRFSISGRSSRGSTGNGLAVVDCLRCWQISV